MLQKAKSICSFFSVQPGCWSGLASDHPLSVHRAWIILFSTIMKCWHGGQGMQTTSFHAGLKTAHTQGAQRSVLPLYVVGIWCHKHNIIKQWENCNFSVPFWTYTVYLHSASPNPRFFWSQKNGSVEYLHSHVTHPRFLHITLDWAEIRHHVAYVSSTSSYLCLGSVKYRQRHVMCCNIELNGTDKFSLHPIANWRYNKFLNLLLSLPCNVMQGPTYSYSRIWSTIASLVCEITGYAWNSLSGAIGK